MIDLARGGEIFEGDRDVLLRLCIYPRQLQVVEKDKRKKKKKKKKQFGRSGL